MNLDKDIIYKIVKNFIYNPDYDPQPRIVGSIRDSISMISDFEFTQLEYIQNPTDTPFDMYGVQYVPGTNGYINVWVNIIYSGTRPADKREFLRVHYTSYLSELREKKLSNMGITIADKIKMSLDSYLEFNSSELFRPDLTRVFGGAIRDIIADMPIHDVDIMCASRSAKRLDLILKDNGYHYVDGLNPKDLSSIYTDIKVITEPKTYIKGTKIIQIIKPSKGSSDEGYIDSIERLISNVDISCCGVSYDGVSLTENVQDSILHCRNKVFKINRSAQMIHNNRIIHRVAKLESRGWVQIEGDVSSNRDVKLDELFKEDSYKDGYYEHIKGW
jgi:hypothetical protein